MLEILKKITATIGRGLLKAFVYVAYRPAVSYTNPSVRTMKEPVIFVGNHTSHKDGIMTSVIFSRFQGNIIVAKDWYEKPKFNWFLKYNRCIPMDRYKVDTEWLRLAKQALKDGQSVIIYPEGRTGQEKEPREFKSGFVMLAVMTGAKIVPYAAMGPYKVIFGKRKKVLIGEPTELTKEGRGLNPRYLEAESERYRQLVIDLMKEIGE